VIPPNKTRSKAPKAARTLEPHNPIANDVANQPAQGMGTELAHDVASVGFCRVNTDPQGYPDLFVTFPFCRERDNFSLAGTPKVTRAVRSAVCLAPFQVALPYNRFSLGSERPRDHPLQEETKRLNEQTSVCGVTTRRVARGANLNQINLSFVGSNEMRLRSRRRGSWRRWPSPPSAQLSGWHDSGRNAPSLCFPPNPPRGL
jgi:hypothetical protein